LPVPRAEDFVSILDVHFEVAAIGRRDVDIDVAVAPVTRTV